MRVLLVSHEASRSGAPSVAVLVARCLVDQGHDVRILSRAPGALLEEFAAVAPVEVEPFHRVRARLRSVRSLRLAAWLVDTLLAAAIIMRLSPDLVYVNSSAAAIYLRPGRWLRRPVLLHCHESGPVTSQFLKSAGAKSEISNATLVACSTSVRVDLARLAGLGIDDVALLPSVPDDARVIRLSEEAAAPSVADESPTLIVGCTGTVESRKGADLWVAAARKVQRALPEREVRFVWVGDIGEPVGTAAGERIEFLGPMANPYPAMRSFDVATLPSRDDPFPLVVLESMILGKPVVAFAVGAVADQIGSAGVLVPPGDVDAFAEAVVDLLVDKQKRTDLGQAARERAHALYSTDTFSKNLATVVLGGEPDIVGGRHHHVGDPGGGGEAGWRRDRHRGRRPGSAAAAD